MAIRMFLDISTGHLGKESRSYLEYGAVWPTVYDFDYGWLVHVPAGDLAQSATDQEASVPRALMACLRHAQSLGCDYIMFDADAGDDPALEWFEDGQPEGETDIEADGLVDPDRHITQEYYELYVEGEIRASRKPKPYREWAAALDRADKERADG